MSVILETSSPRLGLRFQHLIVGLRTHEGMCFHRARNRGDSTCVSLPSQSLRFGVRRKRRYTSHRRRQRRSHRVLLITHQGSPCIHPFGNTCVAIGIAPIMRRSCARESHQCTKQGRCVKDFHRQGGPHLSSPSCFTTIAFPAVMVGIVQVDTFLEFMCM